METEEKEFESFCVFSKSVHLHFVVEVSKISTNFSLNFA